MSASNSVYTIYGSRACIQHPSTRDRFRCRYGSLRCKTRSVSMETSTDMDPKDGFMDRYDAKRSVSMEIGTDMDPKHAIWVTTMQKRSVSMEASTDIDRKDGFYGSLRCKKRSVSMEIGTDMDPKHAFMDHYDAKCDPFRCKRRSISMETSTDMDPKDGFMDRYDAKSDPFRWKQAQIRIQRMALWITTLQKVIRFDGNKHRYGSKGWVYGSLRRKKRSVSME
eukprot:212270_1